MKKIALCMIAKNEAAVIGRCLESARPLIDCVMIDVQDSTDETEMIVREFMYREKVPGEIHHYPWVDFGKNRSKILARARISPLRPDYALMIDADDFIEYDPDFDAGAFKRSLRSDVFDVDIRYGSIRYQRPQIFSNWLPFAYRGIVHEFAEIPPDATRQHVNSFHIRVGTGGARSADPDKYLKAAHLIEQELRHETDPGMRARYTFYLAESWRDCSAFQFALERYIERAGMGCWNEEIYWSWYQAGKMKEQLGAPWTEALAGYYFNAISEVPTRSEAYYQAARLCRDAKQFRLGYELAKSGMENAEPHGALFSEPAVYEWMLLDEFSISAYWSGRYQESLAACDRLLAEGKLPETEYARVMRNRDFAIAKA